LELIIFLWRCDLLIKSMKENAFLSADDCVTF